MLRQVCHWMPNSRLVGRDLGDQGLDDTWRGARRAVDDRADIRYAAPVR